MKFPKFTLLLIGFGLIGSCSGTADNTVSTEQSRIEFAKLYAHQEQTDSTDRPVNLFNREEKERIIRATSEWIEWKSDTRLRIYLRSKSTYIKLVRRGGNRNFYEEDRKNYDETTYCEIDIKEATLRRRDGFDQLICNTNGCSQSVYDPQGGPQSSNLCNLNGDPSTRGQRSLLLKEIMGD